MKLRNKTTGEEFCEVKQEFHNQYEANNEKWDMLSCSKEPVTPPPTTPPPPGTTTMTTPYTTTTRRTTTERVTTTTRDVPTTPPPGETSTTSEETTSEVTTPQVTTTTSIVSTTTCRNVCNTVERCWTESKEYKEWGCDKVCTWIFCHQANCRMKTRCCRQEQVCGPVQECATVCG